ncbi:MAG: glycoside hydrolase [Acidobacteriota bacterium]|nr:glycoside hydrolase [Acidobacteriota bacterium]
MRTTTLLATFLSTSVVGSLLLAAPQNSGPWSLRVEPLTTPAAPDSAQPQLHVSSRGVILSWVERNGPEATLKFAEKNGTAWSAPKIVASGKDWFVNWADVPSVIRLADGTLVGHWLQKSGPDTYAYDVRLSYSKDDGRTWSPSFTPHTDGTKTEHGFASMIQMPGAGLGVVWLDGRKMAAGGHGAPGAAGHGSDDMTLRFGTFGKDWKQTAETELDVRVCECCPTAMAMTSEGPIVAYRDRSPEEVRDILVTRLENGKWTAPKPVHADEWKVPACPVNGPALSARGKNVAVTWFNAKDDKPKSFGAFSSDAGRTFTAPIRLDDVATLGRVDVELLPDGSAVAAYTEFAEQRAQFRVRRIRPDGSKSEPITISGMAGNRGSGYPRMVLSGDELVFAWTDRDTKSQVRTASARLPK